MDIFRFLLFCLTLILLSFLTDARTVRPIGVAREAFEAQFRREMTDESEDKWPVRVSPGGPDPHHH